MDLLTDRTLLAALHSEVTALRDRLLVAEDDRAIDLAATHVRHRRSARNLVHYVELRRHDVRDLQTRLGALGLSSLGRCEAAVLASVDAVLDVLAALIGRPAVEHDVPVNLATGEALLADAADRLLGPSPEERTSRIMVTMPSEAATSPELVDELASHGMDVVRVNLAHDDADAWRQMVEHVRAARRRTGAALPVAVDLAGPKLRTGPVGTAPRVVKVVPRRDRTGTVLAPAVVRLVPAADAAWPDPSPARPVVPIDDVAWLRRRVVGERLHLVDARGSKRIWMVDEVEPADGSVLVSVGRTTYVMAGTELCAGVDDDAIVASMPPAEQAHRVQAGEVVLLTRDLEPADPIDGGPHRIGCTLVEAFDHLQAGHRVWFDDGRIGGVVADVTAEGAVIELTAVEPGGAKLKAGKGINLPDTPLDVDALTPKDLADLDVVAEFADVVDLSFVRGPDDVRRLQDELAARGASSVGMVLKIETRAAFEHLPEVLLAAMRSERIGVMIARGDLAVEVGFDRLAEVQEEIMWICEAAHVPVVWATQVLDTMARTGRASRAEVTDAAMSVRAECVMLNKGPYVVDAVVALDSILRRMQHHQRKKRTLLRRLNAWDRATGG